MGTYLLMVNFYDFIFHFDTWATLGQLSHHAENMTLKAKALHFNVLGATTFRSYLNTEWRV